MKTLMRVLALSLIVSMAAPAQRSIAQVSGEVHINIGPPPPRHEIIITRPDPDAVWVGGYHEWDPGGRAYVWRPGHWDHPPRHGARWIAPRYRRHHDEYIYTPGRWK